jgi:hypothetical protein
MVNPYAPPKEAKLVRIDSPLPPGVRRSHGAFSPIDTRLLAIPAGFVALTEILVLVKWLQAARTVGRRLSSIELLVSARVLRWSVDGAAPFEILLPEVSRIVATPYDVWVVSDRPRRFLGLNRGLGDYDDLCAQLATWKPMESLGRWRGVLFRFFWLGPAVARDGETWLAADPSLREELALVRSLSSATEPPKIQRPFQQRPGVKIVFWVVLTAMFLVIWNLLTPKPQRRAHRAHVAAPPVADP